MIAHRLLFALCLIGVGLFCHASAEEIGPFKQLPPAYSQACIIRIGTWKAGRYRADLDERTLIVIQRDTVEWVNADNSKTSHALTSVNLIIDAEGHWVVEASSEKGPFRIQRFGPLWQMEFNGSTHAYMDCAEYHINKAKESLANDLKDLEESLNGPINPFLRPVTIPP